MPTLEDLKRRLRDEVDLIDLIAESREVTQRGNRHLALCPFHRDTKPSLQIDREKGLYHCFACKAGGDLFDYVQETEGVNFMGALELLARRRGLSLEEFRGGDPTRAREARRHEETLREVTKAARDHWRRALLREPSGQPGRDLAERRGLTAEIAEAFELGFAEESWDALLRALTARLNYRPQTLREAGVVGHSERKDRHYDLFRGRLIFPIWDAQGHPIAFGGRAMPGAGDDVPKYINSPESPIYSKGRVLYAFHLAREAMRERKRAVLCEGYMDVIAAHRAGLTEAVASLGTALTEPQAKLLDRHAERVVLLYDADSAGRGATLRGCEILRREGLITEIAVLPPGQDPDDVLSERGPEALRALVEEAQPALQVLLRWQLQDPEAPEDPLERKIWALERLIPVLMANSTVISREREIGLLAQWLELQEDILRRHLATRGDRQAQDLRSEVQQRKLDRPPAAEEGLVRCALEQPDLIEVLQRSENLQSWVTDPRVRRWIERLLSDPHFQDSGLSTLEMVDHLAAGDADDRALLRDILFADEDYSVPHEILSELLDRLERASKGRVAAGAARAFAESGRADLTPEESRLILEGPMHQHGVPPRRRRP